MPLSIGILFICKYVSQIYKDDHFEYEPKTCTTDIDYAYERRRTRKLADERTG